MKRSLVAGGAGALAVFLLVGCGSGQSVEPALPPVSTADVPSASTAVPSASASTSASSATPVPAGPAVGSKPSGVRGPGGSAVPDGSAVPGESPGPAPTVAPAASADGATAAYAARFCTALGPLLTFKQQNETPNMAGVTNGQQAKELAVRLVTEGITTAETAVRSVQDLGPAPDSQAAAGINDLLASLGQAITLGQQLLPQVRAVDPNNPMALLGLASQAQAQLGGTQTTGLDTLRSSTGPAFGAALRTVPECAPLGV